jgi:hypothetical protein
MGIWGYREMESRGSYVSLGSRASRGAKTSILKNVTILPSKRFDVLTRNGRGDNLIDIPG